MDLQSGAAMGLGTATDANPAVGFNPPNARFSDRTGAALCTHKGKRFILRG